MNNNNYRFSIEPHTDMDKSFRITAPQDWEIQMVIDYDDVDHARIDAEAKRIVRILNRYVLDNCEDDISINYGKECDADNCTNEPVTGGINWRETGYWNLCCEHSELTLKEQPKMKQEAIYRENTRDKVTGFLPSITNRSIK